jgi:hypothetical protein
MSKKEDLERMDLNMLAMYCQRVAEVREFHSMEADQARELKHAWTLLISPATYAFRTQQNVEDQTEQLRLRMVSFLSAVELPLLSMRSHA